jgi:hypothetical protein
MKRNRKGNFLSILMLVALFVTSCGGAGAESDTIATAVAMTVSAQETQNAKATATPTETGRTSTPDAADVSAEVSPTPTKAATFSPPTAPPPVGSGDPCLLANLISETIPDGTIMEPGETFWKTWRLKNNGTCTWNAAYKIVYWSGDLMGGLAEYQFPEVVSPGEEVDVTLFLKAPSSNGNYSSYWKLQSEWGGQFGVGQYDQPFYVQVNVNDSSNPNYTVTNVTYNIVRDPVAGCATNVWYYVTATITTNGPATVRYQWLQSDGNNTGTGRTLKFSEAGSKTLTREWSFHLGATPGTKWMQIVIHEPEYQEFPQATFVYDCGNE